jgi:hypothetical protein
MNLQVPYKMVDFLTERQLVSLGICSKALSVSFYHSVMQEIVSIFLIILVLL